MTYVGSIMNGFKSLLTGLGITGRHFAKKDVTLRYPHQKPELSDAYRSLISLKQLDDLGTHDCVACLQCEKICPSHCIAIDGGKVEGMKRKRASKFEVDFALCSLCGLCVDVCPTETLEYSKYYDEVGHDRQWVYDLLAPFEDTEEAFREQQRAADKKEAEAKAAKKAAADAAKKAAAEKKAAEEAQADKPDAGGEQ